MQNVVERAVISSRSGSLHFHLPKQDAESADAPTEQVVTKADRFMTDDEMRRFERQNLLAVLEKTKWKVSGSGGAAEFLRIHPATLSSRMRAMGIKKPR